MTITDDKRRHLKEQKEGQQEKKIIYYKLIFKSSDPFVCKIDKETGLITAKSPGFSRVSVTTYNGESQSIEVNVVK